MQLECLRACEACTLHMVYLSGSGQVMLSARWTASTGIFIEAHAAWACTTEVVTQLK